MWFLELFEDSGVILVRGSAAQLLPARTYPALEIGDHATHVVRDYLEGGKLVEVAAKDEAGHGCAGLIGPAEDKPDLIFGLLFREIVREIGPSGRMDPDGQVKAGHLFEQWPEFG